MGSENAIADLGHSDALGAAFNAGGEGEFNPLAELEQADWPEQTYDDNQEQLEEVETAPPPAQQQAKPPQEAEEVKAQERKADEAEDRWAARFNKLARQEAEVRKHRAELQQLAKENAELAELKRQLAENPAQAIARLGIRPEQIYEENIKDRANEPLRAVEELKAQMQKELAEVREQTYRLNLRRETENWDNDFNKNFQSEEFAIVRAFYGEPDAIIEHVAENYKKTGKFLTPKELLGTLKDEIESRVNSLESSGYVSRAAKAAAAQVARADSNAMQEQRKRKTLSTNTHASGADPSRVAFGIDDDADMEALIAKWSAL